MLQHLVASSLLICAILAVRALFRGRVSNRLIYALWIVVFIRLVIPGFVFEIELPSRTPSGETVGQMPQDPFTQYDPIITPSVDGDTDASIPQADSAATSKPQDDTPSSEKPDIFGIFKTVYPFGVAAVLLWVAVSELAVWSKLRRSRILVKKEHGIRIFLSDSSISPCVFGILPAVYLNTRTTDSEELELVTKHELAHIRQLDHVRLLCRRLLLAFYWFDPFVWIYAVAAGRDSELACDEAVTAELDERQRIKYARTILNYTPQANSSAAGFGGKPMKKRIMAITGTGKVKRLYVLLALIMSLTVCVLAFTGCVEGKAEATDDEVTESSMPESNDSSTDDKPLDNQSAEAKLHTNGNLLLPSLEYRANEAFVRACNGGMDYSYEELVSMNEDEIFRMMLGPTTRYGFFSNYPILKSDKAVAFTDSNGNDYSVYDLSGDTFNYEWLVSEIRTYFSEEIAVELFSKGIYFEYGEKLYMLDSVQFESKNSTGTKYEIVSASENEITYKATTKYLVSDEDYEKYVMNNNLVFPDDSYTVEYAEYVLSNVNGKWVFTHFE